MPRIMELLVVRHARAVDRETFVATGQPDSERPLTAKGIRRMKKTVRGLRSLVPSIDLLVSSPLRRAVETARIIADAYGGLRVVERLELAPGTPPQKLIGWLDGQRDRSVVCIVGHEPNLSELLAELLTTDSQCPAKLKKGSGALIRFDGAVSAASGKLQWYHSARQIASFDY
jgi:phosphohistidine phosphatase